MRTRTSAPFSRPRRRQALALVLMLGACASGGPSRPSESELAEGGFSISERVRVSSDVREKFAQAGRLLEDGQNEAGAELLVEVTEVAPQLTAAHINLGIAYGRLGDLERALACLERALELNPRHPAVHNELGIVLRRLGRFEQARTSYEKALALRPEFQPARINLAILCDLYLADPACALENYEAYARAVPGDTTAAAWISDLRARSGR